jgi:hypothetical protein
MAALLCMAAPLQAQSRDEVSMVSFDSSFSDFNYLGLEELADAMVENTRLTIRSTRSEKIVMVAGVVDAKSGEILYGRISKPILTSKTPNDPKKQINRSLVGIGKGPLSGIWDAFEDPLLGFEDPLLGFEDPLLGFEDPLLGFEDPLLGFEDPLLGFKDPTFGFKGTNEAIDAIWGAAGFSFQPTTSPFFSWSGGRGIATGSAGDVLEAVWGTNGVAYEDGTKLLILTTVSLDRKSQLRHSAAILPFITFSE